MMEPAPSTSRGDASLPAVWLGSESRTDRLLLATLSVSMAAHVLVIGAQLLLSGWDRLAGSVTPARLVYEPDGSQAQSEVRRRTEERLRELPGPSASLSPGSWAGGYQPSTNGMDALSDAAQLRIGIGSGEGWSSAALHGGSAWVTAVDLANLAAASQGDPVLYSYFSAIREQIQRTANTQAWLPRDAGTMGVVYIGFVLSRSGAIQSSGVVAERSVHSPTLQEIALRIVRTAAPFIPPPTSLRDAHNTILVPIEFARGAS